MPLRCLTPFITRCPCDPDAFYARCCEPLHQGQAIATTAEQLMRSRYSAYAMQREDYLLRTWHTNTRPISLDLTTQPPTWLGLTVKRHEEEGDRATVEFVARRRVGGGSAQRMHETSRFVREDGRWFYLDGNVGD